MRNKGRERGERGGTEEKEKEGEETEGQWEKGEGEREVGGERNRKGIGGRSEGKRRRYTNVLKRRHRRVGCVQTHGERSVQ